MSTITTTDIYTYGQYQDHCDTPDEVVIEFTALPENAPGALETHYRVPDDMTVTMYVNDAPVEPTDFDDRWGQGHIEIAENNVTISYFAKSHDTELRVRFRKSGVQV